MNTFKGTDPETKQGHSLPEGCGIKLARDCALCRTGTLIEHGDKCDSDAVNAWIQEPYLYCIDCGCKFRMDAITLFELGEN